MKPKIPKYLINQVVDTFRKEERELLESFTHEDFRETVTEIITNTFLAQNTSDVRRNTVKQRQRTKKRWVESLEESLKGWFEREEKRTIPKGELFGELVYGLELIHRYGIGRFMDFYGASSIEELKERRLKELHAWSLDTKTRLTHYPYLKDRTPLQIKKAFQMDIVIVTADLLLEHYGGSLGNVIIERPLYYVDHAVFSDGQGKLVFSDEVSIDDELHLVSPYEPETDYKLNVLVSQKILNEEGALRLIDPIDARLFDAVMAKRDLNFVEKRKVYADVGELVRVCYNSDSENAYELTEKRLMKLANIKFNVIEKDRTIVFGIFDYLDIQNTQGKRVAEVTVNEAIYQQYIREQVIRTYSDKINRFRLETSRNLIFPLQKERLTAFFGKENHTGVFPYVYFLHKIRFRANRKDENLKLIEESLKEFMEQGVAVKSYSKVKDTFYITFLPVETDEIEDLLGEAGKRSLEP